MLKFEYDRFLQSLISDDVTDEERKIANLVLQHLEALSSLTTSQGHRIKKIVELAQKNWSSICSEIQPIQEQAEKQTCPFKLIKTLIVGPFRGFDKKEEFDLASRLVLIYGPNGTGKSSFCESLEYGLLGSVTEAETKRFRNQPDYLKNAHTNSFTSPILIGIDNQKNDISIISNEALYRFCFIEKNRIDNFSRIAAQTPAKQNELISTLFGLDEFSDFVRNFTDSMVNHIDLEGEKQKKFRQKEIAIAGFKQHLESKPEDLNKLDKTENELANEYRSDCSFSQMDIELNGVEESGGSINQLNVELQKTIAIKSNLTISSLQVLKQSIEDDITMLRDKRLEFGKFSRELSYMQLYKAIIDLKDNSTEKCPACQTPLSKVDTNPFNHAEIEFKKLKQLGELETSIEKLDKKTNSLLASLSQIIETCCSNFKENNVLEPYKKEPEEYTTIVWWNSLFQQLSDESFPWQHLEKQVKMLEEKDREIIKDAENRSKKSEELKRLRGFADKILSLKARRETANGIFRKAEEEILNFSIENDDLLSAIKIEKEVVAQNQTIANAYSTFVQKLNNYKVNLPAQLVADLGENIVQLYNDFNRHDAECEKLAMVRLPLQQNQHLEISFKNEPDSFFNALHILSEGHIRCIGLAILAAKNIKEKCPLLIFDDPVNAIDDDHRESIRRTIFEDRYFEDKQIILACHGEEFFKDIQNLLPAGEAQKIKSVAFLPKKNDYHIYVDHKCSPRNYIIAAQAHLDRGEKRDALDKSRKALEALAKIKIWNYVRKHGDAILKLQLRSATSPLELRDLTTQLARKIEKDNFCDKNKMVVLVPIKSLLGIDGNSIEWRYLNKGTHEETDLMEFDRQTIDEIVTSLMQIDAALAANK